MSLFIFGYGSLTWRPAFAHRRAMTAVLRGYARRFYQGSTDHRGVPGAPGRVVTLLDDPTELTVGRVYEIEPASRDEILALLDHREKGGYERREVVVELVDTAAPVHALVYFAGPDNLDYLGPASVAEIAAQCASSVSPSGRNDEYVFELERFLRGEDAHDEHVFAIADALRARR